MKTTNVPASKARRAKERKRAKGFTGRNKNTNRITSGVVKKAMANEFTGRKLRKRDMRSLWITRIGIAAHNHQSTYAAFMSGLKKQGIGLNRKMLSELAVSHKEVFSRLVALSSSSNA